MELSQHVVIIISIGIINLRDRYSFDYLFTDGKTEVLGR